MNDAKFPMAAALFVLSAGLTETALADEWGDWDDLPDQLLMPTADHVNAIESLYDHLANSSKDSTSDIDAVITEWMTNIEAGLLDDDDLDDVLDSITDDSELVLEDDLEDWLESQLDDLEQQTEYDLDDLEDNIGLDDDLDDSLDDDSLLDEVEDLLEDSQNYIGYTNLTSQ